MFFLAVMLAGAWVAAMVWLGVSVENGDNLKATYAFALAIVISTFFTFFTRPKITLDRNPIVERMIDFFIALIANIIMAFVSVLIVSFITKS